jgi:hypothetical protein
LVSSPFEFNYLLEVDICGHQRISEVRA